VNAGAPAVLPAGTAQALVTRYEDLRRRIVDGSGWSSRLGLAILRREGLAAWIAAWTSTPGPAAVDTSPDAALRLPDERHAEVVRVLASMALVRLNRRSAP
jgi:hypothetical protein